MNENMKTAIRTYKIVKVVEPTMPEMGEVGILLGEEDSNTGYYEILLDGSDATTLYMRDEFEYVTVAEDKLAAA